MRGDGDVLTPSTCIRPAGPSRSATPTARSCSSTPVTRRRLGQAAPERRRLRGLSLAFSPDGRRVATRAGTQRGGFVDLFDGRTGRHIARLDRRGSAQRHRREGAASRPTRGCSPRRPRERARAASNRLLRWDARTGRPLVHVQAIPGRVVGAARVHRFTAGHVEHEGSTHRHARRRHAATASAGTRWPTPSPQPRPARGLIAFGSREGTVRLLDTRTGGMRRGEERHDGAVTSMRFSSDGRRLLTAGNDERLIVWDTTALHADRGAPGPRPRPAQWTWPSRATAGRPIPPAATAPWSRGTLTARAGWSVPWSRSGRRGRSLATVPGLAVRRH